jgi:hypothetical protein
VIALQKAKLFGAFLLPFIGLRLGSLSTTYGGYFSLFMVVLGLWAIVVCSLELARRMFRP